jgi:GNAT superfamily N-acetyltransferase
MARVVRSKLLKNLTDEEYKRCYYLNFRHNGMMQSSLSWERKNHPSTARAVMVEEDGNLLGWALIFGANPGRQREVHFYVRKQYRRKGVGTILMKKVWHHTSPHEMRVDPHDSASSGFFNAMGL